MRALIIAPGWIGDTLLAQPLFARVHAKFPGATLDALAAPAIAPVLGRMPEIAEVVTAPFTHGELKLGERWRLARMLARNGYQQAYILPNSLKSALIPFFAGIAARVGYVGESRYGLVNVMHRLDADALPLMVDRYAKLAEEVSAGPARPVAKTFLRVDEANRMAALARLGLDASRPIAALCPGAEYGPAKRWPPEHFAALARALADRGMQVWLFGSDKDREVAQAIVAGARACIDLTGKTDLASAIDLLSLARIAVSNDSGLMHVAAALDRPLVALYGSSSPNHTPPLSARAQLVSLGLACSPCYARTCPLGHFRCMKDLLPDRVLGLINEVGR